MIKKACLLILVFLIVSCNRGLISDQETKLQKYEAYYQGILDNEVFIEESKFFDIEAIMNKVNDDYRYSVIIDHPQVAIYNIEMMVIVDDGSVSINYNTVMPASGIFDRSYNLVPNQINEAAGFPKGIILDGICYQTKVTLLVMVAWKSEDNLNSYKEFFRLVADINIED